MDDIYKMIKSGPDDKTETNRDVHLVMDPNLTTIEFLDQLEWVQNENWGQPPPEIQAMLAKGIPENFTWNG